MKRLLLIFFSLVLFTSVQAQMGRFPFDTDLVTAAYPAILDDTD